MNLRNRAARFAALVGLAVLLAPCGGCTDMLPSAQSVAYWTPENILYRMQPNQLGRWNQFPDGLSPEAYYSVSDYPERDGIAAGAHQATDDATTVIKPAD